MAPPFLISALEVGELSASGSGSFIPGEGALYPLCCPQTLFASCRIEKNFLPLPGIEPLPAASSPLIYREYFFKVVLKNGFSSIKN
jgi:hypothetical protein